MVGKFIMGGLVVSMGIGGFSGGAPSVPVMNSQTTLAKKQLDSKFLMQGLLDDSEPEQMQRLKAAADVDDPK